MTTDFSTIEFAHSNFYCHGVSQEKQHFWTNFLSAPMPPPSKGRVFICIIVSPSLTCRGFRRDESKLGEGKLRWGSKPGALPLFS